MLTVDTKGGAIGLLVVALVLLGTWGALLNLAERKGRHMAHTWFDFSLGFFLVALVCALTLGQFGHSTGNEQFIYQLQHSSEKAPLIGFAMGSGVCIFIGNLGLQHALSLLGVTIAVPLFSSCIVIIGTVLNYFLDSGLNEAKILFPGVACFFLAAISGSMAHLFNELHLAREKKWTLDRSYGRHKVGTALVGHEDPNRLPAPASTAPTGTSKEVPSGVQADDIEKGDRASPTDSAADLAGLSKQQDGDVKGGPVIRHVFADQDAPQRAVKLTRNQRLFWGIIIATTSGAIGSLFSPGTNVSTNDSFGDLEPGVQPLTVYTSYFWFCCAFLFLSVPQTCYFMWYPCLGQPKTTWKAWLLDHRDGLWFWGFLSGVVVSAANVLQFLGGQAAGYAASDLVQANPIVATIWGIVLFREYRKSSAVAYSWLVCMYLLYIAAVILLAVSASVRGG